MLRTRDQLIKNEFYNLTPQLAEELVKEGYAVGPSEPPKPIGPSETKPAFPSELKDSRMPKKKRA
jgi:hypothetical protein